MGWKKTVARKALKAGTGGDGFGTERAGGRVYCQFCGCRVGSRLGSVCSRPRCHRRAVLAED